MYHNNTRTATSQRDGWAGSLPGLVLQPEKSRSGPRKVNNRANLREILGKPRGAASIGNLKFVINRIQQYGETKSRD
jgi:hypothetical protein